MAIQNSLDLTATGVISHDGAGVFAGTTFTAGSVAFGDGSVLTQDNANLFYDDTNNRLGVGLTTPLDTLHVVGDVELDHTAAENDDHAFEIVCDANNFADVKAIDIDYITGTVGAANDEEAIIVNIDETSSTGGIVAGYLVLSTSEGSATINGYETGVNINPIVQQSGTFGDADNILNLAVDVTVALSTGGAGAITAFVLDNDTFTIGDAATFDEMEIILDTPASGSGIAPTFEYSTGASSFATFVPADGTNGFRNTGAIIWDSSNLTGWVTAASGNFEIRITRTRNTLATVPILDKLQITSTTEYTWDKNGDVSIKSLAVTTALTVANGGTGASTLTDNGVLLGSGTSPVSVTAVGTNGQVLIGSTGADPAFATITSTGSTIAFTLGANTLNIEVNSPITEVTGTSDTLVVGNSYIANNGSLVTLTLPSTGVLGDTIQIMGKGAGLYKIAQNASQQIFNIASATTAGVTGSLTAVEQYASLTLRCTTANTGWTVAHSSGTFTAV